MLPSQAMRSVVCIRSTSRGAAVEPFETSVLNRFGDVLGANVRRRREIGNRAGHAGDAVEGARRELTLCAGVREQAHRGVIKRAKRTHQTRRNLGVRADWCAGKTFARIARAATTRSRIAGERSAPQAT
jgi:hypothetical protein